MHIRSRVMVSVLVLLGATARTASATSCTITNPPCTESVALFGGIGQTDIEVVPAPRRLADRPP